MNQKKVDDLEKELERQKRKKGERDWRKTKIAFLRFWKPIWNSWPLSIPKRGVDWVRERSSILAFLVISAIWAGYGWVVYKVRAKVLYEEAHRHRMSADAFAAFDLFGDLASGLVTIILIIVGLAVAVGLAYVSIGVYKCLGKQKNRV